MSVKPIPDGYPTVCPCLIVNGAAAALDFYTKVFGAVERMRMTVPGGGPIMHAEIVIGASAIMIADEMPEMGSRSPATVGGTPVTLYVYVPDVDVRFAAALAAGAKEVWPVKTRFYGDRCGTLVDPFGHIWTLSTHVEDVNPEEMHKRFEAMMKAQAAM